MMLGLKDAIRIVPYFVLPQFFPIFAYREADTSLLCLYRGGSLSHKTTPVQAHRGFRLLTLASVYKCSKINFAREDFLQGRNRVRRSALEGYDTLHDLLVKLFNEIMNIEEKAIITEEFKDISNNDMHIIEAIGLGEGNNMSTIAKKLNITVGSLTTSMNSLVKKKYTERIRSEEDRRVVYIRLTEKGIKAYHHHEEFHKKMTDAVVEALDQEEVPVLVKTLNSLAEFFRSYR